MIQLYSLVGWHREDASCFFSRVIVSCIMPMFPVSIMPVGFWMNSMTIAWVAFLLCGACDVQVIVVGPAEDMADLHDQAKFLMII